MTFEETMEQSVLEIELEGVVTWRRGSAKTDREASLGGARVGAVRNEAGGGLRQDER